MTSSLKDKKVTFRLDQRRATQLDHWADQEGVTVSFLVRHLVCRYLENMARMPHGTAVPRLGGMP